MSNDPHHFWLRLGAATAGLSAALAVGAGVASADSGTADGSSDAQSSSTAHKASRAAGSTGNAHRGPVSQRRVPVPAAASTNSVSNAASVVSGRTVTGRSARSEPTAAPAGEESTTTTSASAVVTQTPTEPVFPAAISSPVTLRSMAGDVLRWFGQPPLPATAPIPDQPVGELISGAWIALRRIEYRFFNDYPTAQPVIVAKDPQTGVIIGKLNATDPDGDQLAYTVVDQPDHGSLVIAADGSYTYTPEAAFAHAGGADTFSVVVGDTPGNPWHLHGLLDLLGLTSPTTYAVRLDVGPANFSPVLNPSVTVYETPSILTRDQTDPDGSTQRAWVYADVLRIDPAASDADGDTITVTVSNSQPDRATLVANADGTYLYVPKGFTRYADGTYVFNSGADTSAYTDQINFSVTDGQGGLALALQIINVTYLFGMSFSLPTPVVVGTGSTYIDPAGQSVSLGSTIIPLDGTTFGIGFDATLGQVIVGSGLSTDPSGQLVTGLDSPSTAIQVTGCETFGGCSTDWNVNTAVNVGTGGGGVGVYADSRLVTFFYLGKP